MENIFLLKELNVNEKVGLLAITVFISFYLLYPITVNNSFRNLFLLNYILELSPLILSILAFLQFRRNKINFFRIFAWAYLLDLAALLSGNLNYYLYKILSTPLQIQLISSINNYTIKGLQFISIVILIYAFVGLNNNSFDKDKVNVLIRSDIIGFLIITLSILSYISLSILYEAIDLGPVFDFSNYLPIIFNKILNTLITYSPVFVFCLALWRYRRTNHLFFRFLIIAFFLNSIAIIISHSGLHLSLNLYNQDISQILKFISQLLILLGRLIEIYALLIFKLEKVC